MDDLLKILIVDDSVFYRQLLSSLITDMPGAGKVGTASNGKIAVEKVNLNPPDLVLVDMVMPEMDGLETLKIIKASHPQVTVIMISGADKISAELTMKALEAGALDFVPKPQEDSAQSAAKALKETLAPLVAIVRTRKYRRTVQQISTVNKAGDREPSGGQELKITGSDDGVCVQNSLPGRVDVVTIGVSTGGPNALKKIIPGLPADFPVPILAVQHMPPKFTASLAESLDRISGITVVEGASNQPVKNGVMYIAPGGVHMVVRSAGAAGKVLGLTDSPPVHNCRPAVDVLFRSVGLVYPKNILMVILTGMGSDGAAGVSAIRRKGGYCLVQDRESAVVWGMPGAVVEKGEADEICPLHRMAARICEIVSKGRPI
nr:chemotaxis-specific protein-glutamate methyltransferase CheB [uncultured Desulfobacter sp.]